MNKKMSTGLVIVAGLIFLLTRLVGGGPKSGSRISSASASVGDGAQSAAAGARSKENASAPGVFDYYLLNLSWSPEFCHSHPDAAECAAHPAFVLHGLWPENKDGTYPENCSNAPEPSNPSEYKDIYADQGLLSHEWKTHGTCSGLSADAFFSAARRAYQSVKIPAALSGLHSQTSMPPGQVLDLFAASNPAIPRSSMVLSCGNNYLTAVEICEDKSLHPVACETLRSCRANTVRIVPPGE